MNVQELPMKEFLAHLRRHPLPEIMDEECLAALASVEAEYGETITHGAGLEVRLGEAARYVDYIMNIDSDMPPVKSLWHEIDYAEYKKAYAEKSSIEPCLFANVNFAPEETEKWDAFLPPFLGEARAKNLRPALDRVTQNLPLEATIKQIGTMTSRGELDIMRLVIMFPDWEMVPSGLAAIGWTGDSSTLFTAMEPWKESGSVAVNIDLGASGVLPKIGIELFHRWRHPLLVDKILARLEATGLCLPAKAEALRRWIRLRPDGDPFIQTLISYFKLNYSNGQITEAKAYLEQSPYVHHHYFAAYERPVYVEMELKNRSYALPLREAIRWLDELAKNRVRNVRFIGETAAYEHTGKLLAYAKKHGIRAQLAISSEVPDEWLSEMSSYVSGFIINFDVLKSLRGIDFSQTSAKWHMSDANADELPQVVLAAEKLGVREFIITGMTGGDCPSRNDMERTATFIREAAVAKLKITVDSCFSALRAFLEGPDPTKNANRGIERGCTAGRDHFCVRTDGKLTPCLKLGVAEEFGSLAEYWNESPALEKLREENASVGGKAARPVPASGRKGVASCDCAYTRPSLAVAALAHPCASAGCTGCAYERRCLPCPAVGEEIKNCPLFQRVSGT